MVQLIRRNTDTGPRAFQAEWAEAGAALQSAGAHGQAAYATIVKLLQHRVLSAMQTQADLLESIRDLQSSQECRAAMTLVRKFCPRQSSSPTTIHLSDNGQPEKLLPKD